jgi:hypothetical protein
VRIFLLLLATPTMAVSGRSRPTRPGFPTGTRRCRSSEGANSLLGRRVCACRERRMLLQKLWLSFEASFVNFNTWHLIYNNFNLNFIYGTICLYVCVCAFSLCRESPDMILGDESLIFKVVLSQISGMFLSLLMTILVILIFSSWKVRMKCLSTLEAWLWGWKMSIPII